MRFRELDATSRCPAVSARRSRVHSSRGARGHRVRYTLATRLVNVLVEAADEKILAKTIARYGRVDLLIINELGYILTDPRLCAAIVDRLTYHGTIIETGTTSYRLANSRFQAAS